MFKNGEIDNSEKIATKKNIFYVIIPLILTLLLCIINRYKETVQNIECWDSVI